MLNLSTSKFFIDKKLLVDQISMAINIFINEYPEFDVWINAAAVHELNSENIVKKTEIIFGVRGIEVVEMKETE